MDEIFARIDAGEPLTGEQGLLGSMLKAALERGLDAELTEHVGYERGDAEAALFDNSRNGVSAKTVSTEIGDVELAVPRDRNGTFTPMLIAKGARRLDGLDGLDGMIISLYAGGMTIRDGGHVRNKAAHIAVRSGPSDGTLPRRDPTRRRTAGTEQKEERRLIMVATGARAREPQSILLRAGLVQAARPSAPRLETLPSHAAADILDLYRVLGGTLAAPALAPGSWDLSFSNELLVEFDEYFHFNRYRALTLERPWAASLPWQHDYLEYSRRWERYSGTGGKRWSNDPAKRMFGGADPDGVFGKFGAPRWKQRALYDAMKDVAAATRCVRLARVSIYDEVDAIRLDDILDRKASAPAETVAALVGERVAQA